MTAERDTTRIVRSWLRTDEHESADRILETVLSRLDATPQRRSLWPSRRFVTMNNPMRIAIAAAAVLVVAVLGYNLLPGNGGVGGQPTSSPTATPVPSPTAALPEITVGLLSPGTYLVSRPTDALRPYTVTVPAGWRFDGEGFIRKGGEFEGRAGSTGVAFATWIISHVYGDSCRWPDTLREAGTRQLLATALAEQTGHVTAGPTDVTLSGYAASRLELSVPADFDPATCASSVLRLWPDAGPNESGGHRIYPGQTTIVYAVEEGGKAMAVLTVSNEESPAGDVAELQAILDSIIFMR